MAQELVVPEVRKEQVVILKEPTKLPPTGSAPLLQYTGDLVEQQEILTTHGTLPKNKKSMFIKGYELFDEAIRLGLTQVVGSLGNAKRHEACALGAMFYIVSDGRRVKNAGLFASDQDYHKDDLVYKVMKQIDSKAGHRIETLNDSKHWSYEDFRDFCIKHDI